MLGRLLVAIMVTLPCVAASHALEMDVSYSPTGDLPGLMPRAETQIGDSMQMSGAAHMSDTKAEFCDTLHELSLPADAHAALEQKLGVDICADG